MQKSGFKKISLNPSESLYNHSISKERTVRKLDIIREIHPNESNQYREIASILNSNIYYNIFTMWTLVWITDSLALLYSISLEMNLQDSLVLAPHLLYFPLPSCSGMSDQGEVGALGLKSQSDSH